ncbi:MAG: hypothetical protein IT529_04365 [Burkholderiales bacterium]|nr:hypothetical protein [Burkholderiales bacterium]
MSQNINLLGPAFRKRRQSLTLNTLAVCIALVVAALAAVYGYVWHQSGNLAAELSSAQALAKAQRRYLDKLQAEAAASRQNVELEKETARLELELKQARDSMNALKGGAIGTEAGFAEYLRAFSRQSVDGLWLTGLAIGGGELAIRGRTLAPDLMPGYIQRLTREKVLAGVSFDHLELAQPRAEPGKGADKEARGDAEKRAEARPPRYLEFNLATASSGAAEKAP